ncbi:hypothetical protein ACFX16_031124 [Malus domestica]
MDVKNAFLHGDLEDEVYMKLPPRHPQESQVNKVCKLHKAIYGLKQSPRAWYSKLSSVLEAAGFKRSHADSSLFVCSGPNGKLIVLIYVDDLIITGDNIEEIATLKSSIHQHFAIKDLGTLKYFLGIEMATSAKGKLIYLTITRPDIAYSVSLISQFMHSHTLLHWEIVKRILRYLKGSIGRGLLLKNHGSNHIMAYIDVDWAGNALDRKSTTRFCTFVGGNLVTWKSKKHIVIARSSA